MIAEWSEWKSFPDPALGNTVEAPGGPGLFELRQFSRGRQLAFGPAENVARALSSLPHRREWPRRKNTELIRLLATRPFDVEYRTCPAPSLERAKRIEQDLLARRHHWFARRLRSYG